MCASTKIYAQTSAERREERANRGIITYDNIFVEKGQWTVGAAASYSAHSNENYDLVLVDNINSMGYNFDVSAMFAYAFSNNNSVGARISYDRSLLRVDSATLGFGDEDSGGVSLTMDDCYLLNHSYTAMAIMRQYIPLGSSKRFALFNEIRLSGGGSQSKFSYDSPVQGTYSTTKEVALNFAPGITAFISNRFAFEVNVGAMGLSYTQTDQVHNQVETGQTTTNMFNFKINLLSLGFGIAYYL